MDQLSSGEMEDLAERAASYIPNTLPSVRFYGGTELAPHLCVRWVSDYFISTDSEIVSVDAVVGYGLSVPTCYLPARLPLLDITLASRSVIKNCCLHALEHPGQRFAINFDSGICSFQKVEGEAGAEDKSLLLMKEWLTPQQRADFEKYSAFNVIGGSTGYCYRLTCSTTFNIKLGFGAAICVEPDRHESRTQGDRLLAQKIGLETLELELLRIAKVNMGAEELVAKLLELPANENPAVG